MMGETAKQKAIRALFPALLVLRYGAELRAAPASWAAASLGMGGELTLEPRALAELPPPELPHRGVCARAACNAAVLVLQRCFGCVQYGAGRADGSLKSRHSSAGLCTGAVGWERCLAFRCSRQRGQAEAPGRGVSSSGEGEEDVTAPNAAGQRRGLREAVPSRALELRGWINPVSMATSASPPSSPMSEPAMFPGSPGLLPPVAKTLQVLGSCGNVGRSAGAARGAPKLPAPHPTAPSRRRSAAFHHPRAVLPQHLLPKGVGVRGALTAPWSCREPRCFTTNR